MSVLHQDGRVLALTRSLVVLLLAVAAVAAGVSVPAARAQSAPEPVYLGTDDTGVPRYRLPAGASPLPGPQRTDYFVTVGGRERVFRLHVPSGLDEGPVPLVAGLHALYSDRRKAEAVMDWQRLAPGQFVLVYPQGLDASWNAGRCCGRSSDEGVDDVAVLTEVLRLAGRAHPVDPRRRYVTGLSNGGMMALALACARPDVVAAVLAVAAAHMTPCRPGRGVPLMQVHGTGDSVVPYGGTAYSDFLRTRVPSVADTQNLWRRANTTPLRPTAVVRLEGGPHAWPTTSYDTTGRGWTFLRSQVNPCRPYSGPRPGRDRTFRCA